jgi:hypothetical protein
MSLCKCQERPRCEWDWCQEAADWSVWQPRWGERRERFRFICEGHFQMYRGAMTKPIRGIDRPENADEEWRGSLLECIRHAQIAMAFENRNTRHVPEDHPLSRPDDAKRYTSAQLAQVMVLRRQSREQRR